MVSVISSGASGPQPAVQRHLWCAGETNYDSSASIGGGLLCQYTTTFGRRERTDIVAAGATVRVSNDGSQQPPDDQRASLKARLLFHIDVS